MIVLLITGVFGTDDPDSPTSIDSLIEERNGMRFWIDGKARPVIVATPVAHRINFEQMTDAELVEIYRGTKRVLSDLGFARFSRLVINTGMFQTHAHIHLKAYIDKPVFDRAVQSERWRARGLTAKYERIDQWIQRVEGEMAETKAVKKAQQAQGAAAGVREAGEALSKLGLVQAPPESE